MTTRARIRGGVALRLEAGRATVAIERRVDREARILFADEEEDLKTDDRSVEKRILDDIGRSL
jgi:hypothetical protein